MAANGARLLLTNTTLAKAQRVQADLAAEGLSCDIFQLDVTNDPQVREVIAAIAEKYGRIDVLINTAGIGAHSEPENYPPEVVRQVVDVNLNGTVFLCREVGKVMIRQGGGKIVNIGSIAGDFCHTYLSMPYECSKAAVHQLTRSLAVTWAKYNINVNCIAPTWVYTPMLEGFQDNTYERIIEQHPPPDRRRERLPGAGCLPLHAGLQLRDRSGHLCGRRLEQRKAPWRSPWSSAACGDENR